MVAGAEPLKPITWSVWAGNIEKEGGSANPYRGLEDRAGFMDIRVSKTSVIGGPLKNTDTCSQTKRKEFADWIRERDLIVKR